MTIFDALKYKISNPPTKEELSALPRPMFHACLEKIGLRPALDVTPYQAAYYLSAYTNHKDPKYRELALEHQRLIIQAIAEYDNLPHIEIPDK